MPSEFESGVFAGGLPAWHGLGVVLDDPTITLTRALEVSGLKDWGLQLRPVFTEAPDGSLVKIAGEHGVYRGKDGSALGVVGDRYTLVSNERAFEWCEQLVGEGAMVHTAGSLRGGRVVWILFRAPFALDLPDSRVDMYVLVSNAHDGSMAVKGSITPTRVVCQNTLTAALGNARRQISIRHYSGSLDQKLSEAQKVLGMAREGAESLEVVADQLVGQKISEAEFCAFLDELVHVPEDKGRGQTIATQVQDTIRQIYYLAPDQKEIQGTAWGVLNAVTAYWDHNVSVRLQNGADAAENRALRIWFSSAARSMPERAMALLR